MKFFLVFIISWFSIAYADEVQDRTNSITKNLRCLVCEGQSVYESNSDFAKDIKTFVSKKIKEKNTDEWPKIQKNLKIEEKIKLAIQINGKTKKIVEVAKDIDESKIMDECLKFKNINEQLSGKKIIKTIFIKNKVINYLIN